MNETETEVSSEGGIHGSVSRAKAEDEVIGPETTLSGAWEVSEGVEEYGGGGFDLSIGETAEWNVFDGGDAGERIEFEGTIFDAV